MAHDASIPGSGVKWTLSGTVANTNINCSFTVPTSYQWQTNKQAIRLQDPCNDSFTLVVRSDGTSGKLFGRPTIRVQGSEATNAIADLRIAWDRTGPWTLTVPEGSLSVLADPTQGDWQKQNLGSHWEVQMGFLEA